MKRTLLAFCAITAMIMTACQADKTFDDLTNIITNDGTTTISVSLAQTRTSLGSKGDDGIYPVYWSEGDRIVVNGKLSEEVKINKNNRANAEYTVNSALDYPHSIVYPYSTATTAERPIVEFPAEQVYTQNSFAAGYAPMCGYVAKAGSKSVSLSHLAATLRFPVKAADSGVVLEKIVITSTSGEKLAGEFEVDCANVAITPTDNTYNSVTYSLPANYTLSTKKASVFYITLPAVNVGECTIEFIEASGSKMTSKWNPSKPLSKGVVREFKEILYERKAGATLEEMPVEEDELIIYYKNLSGYVRYSSGSPIKGVAVSDGFQVVTTDKNGYYELKNVSSDTWYIYCSLPANVEVPTDEYGRPNFFKKYESNTRQYDFTFKKLSGGKESKFALLALADTQVGDQKSVTQFKAQAAPEIKSYANSLDYKCYGVALGDVIYSPAKTNNEYLMPEMRQAFKECGIPVFAVFGNHDNAHFAESKPVFTDSRNSNYNIKIQRPFEECFGPINYSFNRGDVHIVCMRNMQWNTNNNPGGDNITTTFSDAQYEWLRQDLACVSKDKTIVLCVHIPIFNKSAFNEALSLLDQFEASYILSGHLHFRQCYDYVTKGTGHKAFEQSWAMSHSAKPNINCDGSPHGYGVILFEGGAMKKSIHKGYPYGMNSEDYQIRLHRGGDITGAAIPEGDANKYGTKGYYQFPYDKNTILANVFSSDPWYWTVEVWYYDKATGARTVKIGNMTSLSSYGKTPAWEDLIGSFTYDDPKRAADGINSGRDFWTTGVRCGYLGSGHEDNYHVCYTMWKFTLPSDPIADIMVVATDRWGNEYTQTKFQEGTDMTYAIYDETLNP